MLTRLPGGTWLPSWVPQSTSVIATILMVCSMVQSATIGYDGSCLNGLNILPSYVDYFNLNAATTGLNTASIFIGGIAANLVGGMCTDHFGRRVAMFYFSLVSIVGIVLQAAAQNVAMFVIARIVLGFGTGVNGIAAAVYLNETFPSRWRSWGAAMLNNFYCVGALIASGITLGTSKWPTSTWAWRLPSLLQGAFALICILMLPFCPESPRWLVNRGFLEEARLVVGATNADGDVHDPMAMAVYREIVDTLEWEKNVGKTLSPLEIFRGKATRLRLMIGASPGLLTAATGNVIASYYLGAQLETAGITSTLEQLKVNVVLNVWSFVCAMLGTQLIVRWGRKPSALLCQFSLIVMLYLIGAFTKMNADNISKGITSSDSLVYGTVACIFLFSGFYSLCYTPITTLYPPEVFNYSMRANGFAFMHLLNNCSALVLVYVMPIGIEKLGWKMYMINASWDWLFLAFIAIFWIETKGKTLEEIDAIFDGEKHSDVPDIDLIRKGQDDDHYDKEAVAELEDVRR